MSNRLARSMVPNLAVILAASFVLFGWFMSERLLFQNVDHTPLQVEGNAGVNSGVTESGVDKIHITHLLSTFSTPISSPAYLEQKIVQESYWKAAQKAKLLKNLNVEFIDTTLPDDTGCSPAYAKRYDLKFWLKDVRKGRIRTVGEPFMIAKEYAKGDIIIYTNADIGVVPDFYIRAWDWATKDYATNDAQIAAIKYTAKYAQVCFFELSRFRSVPYDHFAICAEDAKVFYVHAGGFFELWNSVALQVALQAIQLQLNSKEGEVTLKRIKLILQSLTPGDAQNLLNTPASSWKAKVSQFSVTGVSEERLKSVRSRPFAGTITRLDAELNQDVSVSNPDIKAVLKNLLSQIRIAGLKHPGNDCFIYQRNHIPEAVLHLGHPAGVRPFGQWLATLWMNSGSPFRRISGTRENPWTFHAGVGAWGLDSIPWEGRAEADPIYTLFLAANFDQLGQGTFLKMLHGPVVCRNSTRPYRAMRFCNELSQEYCIGVARHSCVYSLQIELRDVLWYHSACVEAFDSHGGKINNPVCEFCNSLFAFHTTVTSKRFECESGKMKYCEGLPDAMCPY